MKINLRCTTQRPIRLAFRKWFGIVCLFIVCATLASLANGQTSEPEWRPYREPVGDTVSNQVYDARPSPTNYGNSEEPLYNAPTQFSPSTVFGEPYVIPSASQGIGNELAPPSTSNWDPYAAPAQSPSANKQLAPKQGGLSGSDDKSPFQFRTLWEPSQPVQGQPTDLGMAEYDLTFKVPVWMSGPDIITLSGEACLNQFQTNAVLPNTGRAFPSELWNIQAGVNYIRRFDNGWTGGMKMSLGSACDQPFDSLRDVTFTAVGFLRVPRGEHDAWSFSVAYRPMSDIPYPIPLVSYHWEPSDMFNMDIGVPFRITYRPTERLTLEASYMLLTTVHTQATYQFGDSWQLYGAYDWENRDWFLHDREDYLERLFSYDQRLSVGVRTTVFEKVAVDLSTGYTFDRYYFTGQNFSDRNHDRVNIDSGVFAALRASLRF